MNSAVTESATIRALRPDDLAAVVAIDAAIEGRPRRHYIERRLQAAVREPKLHAQLAASDERGLAGYILARVLEGEFGRSETGLRLEMVGVRDDHRGHGVGRQLFDALAAWGRRHGVRELRTSESWRNARMLHWFDAMGFELAPIQIVDCAVDGGRYDTSARRRRRAARGTRAGPRDRLRRARGQRLRAPGARRCRRAFDGAGRPGRYRSHRPRHHRA